MKLIGFSTSIFPAIKDEPLWNSGPLLAISE